MNNEALLKLADFLENEVTDEHFNMSGVLTNHHTGKAIYIYPNPSPGDFATLAKAAADCGTAACVLGWAQLLFNNEYAGGDSVLDLPAPVQEKLFTPRGWMFHKKEGNPLAGRAAAVFTPANAAKAIRELVATGQVPEWWSI